MKQNFIPDPPTDVPPLDPDKFVQYFEPSVHIIDRLHDPRRLLSALEEFWSAGSEVAAAAWRIRNMIAVCAIPIIKKKSNVSFVFPEELLRFSAIAPLSYQEFQTGKWEVVSAFLRSKPANWLLAQGQDNEPAATYVADGDRYALSLGKKDTGPYLFIVISNRQGEDRSSFNLLKAVYHELLETHLHWLSQSDFKQLLNATTGLEVPLFMTPPSGWLSINAVTSDNAVGMGAIEKTGLFIITFIYPPTLTVSQALLSIEDTLFAERARLPEEVSAALVARFALPIWLVTALLFVESALRKSVSPAAIAFTLSGLVECAHYFDETTDPAVSAWSELPRAVARAKIDEVAREILYVSHQLFRSDKERSPELAADDEQIRPVDKARAILKYASLLWNETSICQTWTARGCLELCNLNLPLVDLVLGRTISVAGVALPTPSAEEFATGKYLWMQALELQRDGIPAEALRALMADGQSLAPWPRDESPIGPADRGRIRRIEEVLQQESDAQAAFAPGGCIRLILPKQITLLEQYGTRQLLCYIDRASGDRVRGIWVRVYEKRFDNLCRNFIVYWEIDHALRTSLIPEDYGAWLHMIMTGLLHDLRVSGEEAFPLEGKTTPAQTNVSSPSGTNPDETTAGHRRKKKKSATASPIMLLPRFSLKGRRSWSTDEEREHMRRRAHHVDGHRRELPDGWRPRDTAQKEALLDNIILRDGETYVNPHERGLTTQGASADGPQPRHVVARGLAILITNFWQESS